MTQWRGEVITSHRHGSKIFGSQQAVVLQVWKEKNEENCHV